MNEPAQRPENDILVVLLPLLIVLSTLFFLLLLFLISILILRRRRGISLSDYDGPVDMSREDYVDGDGGFEAIQNRWLESVSEPERRQYLRAKEFQLQYPPNSLPTDITLSQFLSIQEKGVSAWSFEPDYETVNSLLVHARTEITFLPDPASASCVQSNLPLPKLNEVYYWEVKMFDLPEPTTVSVGLSTKPYPAYRLPGHSKYSIALHSNGDKSHNWPFTATSYSPQIKEGDVIGVGYRPRAGTVFFTRNGRKMDDAFTGMSRWNLFPTIGADGPCSVHVNFGQSGFVFIEANVKKWGLAPSVGTLAPPPAYGSEQGSILLDVGGGTQTDAPEGLGTSAPSPTRRNSRRRPRNTPSTVPSASSPLRTSSIPTPLSPPPPITPIDEEPDRGDSRYISPTDMLFHEGRNTNLPASPGNHSEETPSRSPSPDGTSGASLFSTPRRHHRHSSLTHAVASFSNAGTPDLSIQVHPPPESPHSPNPPTPNHRDIHLQALSSHRRNDSIPIDRLGATGVERREPTLPPYSPLDAFAYADGGVHLDLPADVIAAALEGRPSSPPEQERRTRRR